jgi:hypothetical protein
VLSTVAIALAVSAAIIGATGAWSPCGFSMVDTIGPTGHAGGRRTTLAACVTFALGAVAGGVVTFGLLAALGGVLHGTGGERTAYLVAATIAAAAAALELRGVRIVPQVRRQVPEHWRRVMPLPLAAGLYGVLLGLGFTTFVLTLGVWALAGVCIAAGQPELGIVVGVAFGVGRALPVVALAPLAGRPAGLRLADLMMERPVLLRAFRIGDALTLLAVAASLAAADPGQASVPSDAPEANGAAGVPGSDPSVAGEDLVWEGTDGASYLRRRGRTGRLVGREPAVGGPNLAVLIGTRAFVVDRHSFAQRAAIDLPGADALAVNERWLVYRLRDAHGDRIVARRIARPEDSRVLASSHGATQLSRPSVLHARLAFAVNGRRGSKIVVRRLEGRGRRTLARTHRTLLTNPALSPRALLYVRTTRTRQQLVLRSLRSGRSRVVYSIAATSKRDRGYERGRHPHRRHRIDLRRSGAVLWSTAIGPRHFFVTRLRFGGGRTNSALLSIRR